MWHVLPSIWHARKQSEFMKTFRRNMLHIFMSTGKYVEIYMQNFQSFSSFIWTLVTTNQIYCLHCEIYLCANNIFKANFMYLRKFWWKFFVSILQPIKHAAFLPLHRNLPIFVHLIINLDIIQGIFLKMTRVPLAVCGRKCPSQKWPESTQLNKVILTFASD